MQESKVVERVW